MIRDGAIVHEVQTGNFQNWQFDSEPLNIVIVAILMTIISYQLTNFCFNIVLGRKTSGTATANDIHKLLLIESSSPREIVSAVVGSDAVNCLRFENDNPRNTKIAKSSIKVIGSALGITSLLLVAPIFNLVSIFVSLQRVQTVSFNEAKFGGVALGVADHNISFQPFSDSCRLVSLRVIGPATPVVKFLQCLELAVSFDKGSLTGDGIRISAEKAYQGQIKVSAITLPSSIPCSISAYLDLASAGKLFRIEPVLTSADAAQLVHAGQEKLANYCNSARLENSPHDENLLNIEEYDGMTKVYKDFPCSLSESSFSAISVIHAMTEQMTILGHDRMNVVDSESIESEAKFPPDFINAGKLPFLIRRGRNVNLLPLSLVMFLSVIFRILSDLYYNNDIEEAIEAILRYRLDVEPHESMLRSSRTITYYCKCRDDSMVNIGSPRSSSQKV